MEKNSLNYSDLMTSLKTTQDVAGFTSEIDTFLQKGTLDAIGTNTAEKIKKTFAKNNLDANDKNIVAGFFSDLKELLKKLKVIKLVLAFNPSQKMLENLHNFVEENIGAGYILDIEILDEVLGGAIVMFNGRYSDFTLKKTIEETFANKNTEIQKFIHSDFH